MLIQLIIAGISCLYLIKLLNIIFRTSVLKNEVTYVLEKSLGWLNWLAGRLIHNNITPSCMLSRSSSSFCFYMKRRTSTNECLHCIQMIGAGTLRIGYSRAFKPPSRPQRLRDAVTICMPACCCTVVVQLHLHYGNITYFDRYTI